MRFNDPRRFGYFSLARADTLDAHPHLAGLGPEPLGNMPSAPATCVSAWPESRPRSRRRCSTSGWWPGSATSMSARRSTGPASRRRGAAGTLDDDDCARLVVAVRGVLEDAIAAGGSSLRDYVQSDGELGYFQHSFSVYDREGRPCPDCPDAAAASASACAVQRIVQHGRSTFYCSTRQR